MKSQIIHSLKSIGTPLTATPAHAFGTDGLSDDMPELAFNLVVNCTDTTPTVAKVSWKNFRNELLSRIPDDHIREQKDGPAWIPATLKDQTMGRNLTNIDMLTCIVLDVDHGMTFDEGVKRVADWGYEAAIHTSYSHTPGNHRFRVILPLATHITATEAKPLFDLMQATFDNKLDPACLEASRLFYLPSCPKGAVEHYGYEHVPGRLLSIADAGATPEGALVPNAVVMTGCDKLTLSLPFAKVPVGSRHTALTKLTGTLLAKGNVDAAVMADCFRWNASLDEPLPESEVEKTIKGICSKNTLKVAEAQSNWDNVTEAMNRKYAWLSKPLAIYRFQDGSIVTGSSLIAQYANCPITINLDGTKQNVTHYGAWLKSPNRREHDDLTFNPGQPEIVNNCVNLWKAWGAEPAAGDVTPWTQLMDFIFGVGSSERCWMEQWLAYPLQHPGTKLKTCVVLWSTQQGVGKSMLGATVGKLYGNHAKTITGKELHSQFNGWAQESLFVMGEENSSGDHRADSNKLKELITGDTVYIEEKFRTSTSCPNQMNFLFTSNHPDAFHLETADRRYFVWSIDKAPMLGAFYDAFIAWRDSVAGLSALMAHLLSIDLTGFDPHGHAPMTAAKLEMKEMSKTELERWITDAISDSSVVDRFGSEVMSTQELVRIYQNDTGSAKGSDTALTKALRRQCAYAKRRINAGKGKKVSVVSLKNHEHWATQSDAQWALELNKYSFLKLV